MTRTATINDFKVGNTLITKEGFAFFIYNELTYCMGSFEARGEKGCKVLNSSEASNYRVSC